MRGGKGGPRHEADFKSILIKYGFRSIRPLFADRHRNDPKKAAFPKDLQHVDMWHGVASIMSPMTFVEQPWGSQGTGDFAVCPARGVLWVIDTKSSKTNRPLLNSQLKQEVLYLFSGKNKKDDDTTLFYGKDVQSKEDEAYFRMWKERVAAIEADMGPPPDTFKRGLRPTSRPRSTFSGTKGNFFTHPSRSTVETRVFEQLRDNLKRSRDDEFMDERRKFKKPRHLSLPSYTRRRTPTRTITPSMKHVAQNSPNAWWTSKNLVAKCSLENIDLVQ